MEFRPRALAATHSTLVSSNSGVTSTFRMLTTLWEPWSASLTYRDEFWLSGGEQGPGVQPGKGRTGGRTRTRPSTVQEMLGRGYPHASQDRSNVVFAFTCILCSFRTIHGEPEEWGCVSCTPGPAFPMSQHLRA